MSISAQLADPVESKDGSNQSTPKFNCREISADGTLLGKIMTSNDNMGGDLLIGATAIGKHLGISGRQVYRLIYDCELPTFKLGGSIAARRSTLDAWILKQEQDARAAA